MSYITYLFVIDAETYAGNFERQLCAYITGHVGECGVGETEATIFREETGLGPDIAFSNVLQKEDEDHCARPATIYPTLGWFNDGMGNFYRDTDPDEGQVARYAKAIEDYNKHWEPQLLDNRARLLRGETVSNWTVEAVDKELQRHQQAVAAARALPAVRHWPAYLSAGVWFSTIPTAEQIALMKVRAFRFFNLHYRAYGGDKIQITGFRLVTVEETTTETPVAI